MINLIRVLIAIVAVAQVSPSWAWTHGVAATPVTTLSQITPNFFGGGSFGEYPLLNKWKSQAGRSYMDNSGVPLPTEMDANGYILPTANAFSHGGWSSLTYLPSQSARPGPQVTTWTGRQRMRSQNNGANGTVNACTGTSNNGANTYCDNQSCTDLMGYIVATTLTVTVQPTGSGCSVAQGAPLSGSGVAVSTFDIPTFITSTGTPCGPNTCYTVNISQTVGSSASPVAMTVGGRMVVASPDAAISSSYPGAPEQKWVQGVIANSSTTPGGHLATYHINDEAAMWAAALPCPGAPQSKGCIIDPNFKAVIKQGGFGIVRDLDWALGNTSTCTTWATRKPITYISYLDTEPRNASSGPGQYVNAAGTGASGGTISYNSGTDTYSITLGSGNWADKQTIIVQFPSTGTMTSQISLNGNTAVPIWSPFALPIASSTYTPTANRVSTLIYDAGLNAVMNFTQGLGVRGLDCGMPPEVVIELNAEMGTIPWHTPSSLSMDTATDWVVQYATYQKANYTPPGKPIFETDNEGWNCSGAVYNSYFLSAKSRVYIAADPSHWSNGTRYCGSGGDLPAITGKIASTMGQDLTSVYGAGNFDMTASVWPIATPSNWAQVMSASSYVNQTMAAQSGYTKTAAWNYLNRVSVNDYWNAGYAISGQIGDQNGNVAKLSYCYFYYSVSTACQSIYASQQAAMDAKMNSSLTSGINSFAIPNVLGYLQAYQSAMANCLQATRPVGCVANTNYPLAMYEGGYNELLPTSDLTQAITSGTNAGVAVLSVANNGCVAGQAVGISSLTGGTWPTAAGTYTVQASGTDANHCAINLNSTSLGTLSAATLTYTGSVNYVSYATNWSYLQSSLTTLTSNFYSSILSAGGQHPSQFNLASASVGIQPWLAWAYDTVGGFFPVASCTSCTIATNQMTLGGTISGIFTNGLVVLGAGVSGIGTGAGTNSVVTGCSTSGSGPCGSQAGDILTLSQSSTVASGVSMSGNVPPNTVGSNISSAVGSWKAICNWNGTGSQC